MTLETGEDQTLDRRLDSWKTIAEHFGRSTRTVQRWQTEYGLPVYSLGGPKSPVFAFLEELDGWIKGRGRSISPPPAENDGALVVFPRAAISESPSSDLEFDTSLIAAQASAQSTQLVALAGKLWESLSFRNITQIVEHYRKAVDWNPANAAAYAGLSLGLIAQGTWGLIGTASANGSAKAALQAAFALDAELPLARCAQAWLKMLYERDWDGAREGFNLLLRGAPNCTRSINGRGLLCIAEGRIDLAAEFFIKSENQAPLSSAAAALLCWSDYLEGNFERALNQVREMRSSGRPDPIIATVEALISALRIAAEDELDRIQVLGGEYPDNDVLQGALGYAYAKVGNRDRALDVVSAIESRSRSGMGREPYGLAITLIGLGDYETAVACLESSYRDGSLWSLGFVMDSVLEPLRNDPHFKSFMSRASYPNADSLQK